MAYRVALIPGDGIGPEVAEAARRCLEATGVAFEWTECIAGEAAIVKHGTPLPEATLQTIRETRVAIKGPITTPIGTGFRSVNVALRKQLDLYAGIEFPAGAAETRGLIQQIARLAKQPLREESAISIKPISAAATERIVTAAFEYALAHGRKKVTAVHKANIMKCTDGLFMDTARRVAKAYERRVAFEDRLVDATCMQLVLRPQEFDVLVLPNLYGDIVSELCAGLIGGLGVAPGANIGEHAAVFEAVHGSAPKYAGMNKVNPTAMILSGVMLLDHLGESAAATRLETAVRTILREGRAVTYDLKPTRDDPTAVGTREMADAVIAQMQTGRNAPARR